MKKYFLILVAVFICIFSFGCQQESQIKNYSIEEIETCLKEAKYNIDNEYDGFQQYIRKGNIVAIYSKDMYSNIEDILESILNCKPIDYESVILKLK